MTCDIHRQQWCLLLERTTTLLCRLCHFLSGTYLVLIQITYDHVMFLWITCCASVASLYVCVCVFMPWTHRTLTTDMLFWLDAIQGDDSDRPLCRDKHLELWVYQLLPSGRGAEPVWLSTSSPWPDGGTSPRLKKKTKQKHLFVIFRNEYQSRNSQTPVLMLHKWCQTNYFWPTWCVLYMNIKAVRPIRFTIYQ